MTRTALVVGGSGGIGSAIVRRLADDGLRVRVGYTHGEDRALAVVASLPGDGHEALQVDVTDRASIEAAAARLDDLDGSLDVLVNAAGVTRHVAHDDLDALDDDTIDRIFAVNWRGSFSTVRALRGLLERSGDGVVVNVSSIAATTGIGSNVAYCASKAALDSMTRSLARALAPRLRVMSVAPGWVMGEYAASAPDGYLDGQRAQTPLGRLAQGEDVAAAVSAIVHDLVLTTGAIVPVDGGRTLGVR